MAVAREQYGPSSVRGGGDSLEFVRLERSANGDWFGTFRVRAEKETPDGRVVEFFKPVRIRANGQMGRRRATA